MSDRNKHCGFNFIVSNKKLIPGCWDFGASFLEYGWIGPHPVNVIYIHGNGKPVCLCTSSHLPLRLAITYPSFLFWRHHPDSQAHLHHPIPELMTL